MKISNPSKGMGFGIGNILGLIFVLVGILLVLNLMDFDLPVNLENASTALQYVAALGSILGGISMLFRKKETVSQVPV